MNHRLPSVWVLAWLVCAWTLAGCGRIGFGVQAGDKDGGTTDGAPTNMPDAGEASIDADARDASSDGQTPTARGEPTFDWFQSYSGASAETVALDSEGSLYVGGHFSFPPPDFGGGGLAPLGQDDGFLFSLSSDGTHRWSLSLGTDGPDRIYDATVGPEGTVHATGQVWASLLRTGNHVFVASHTGAGVERRSTRYEAGWGTAADTGASGHLYLTGVTEVLAGRALGFGGDVRVSAGFRDIFVASFTSTGGHKWSIVQGGPGEDRPLAIAVDESAAQVYVAGKIDDSADVGDGPETVSSSGGAFLAAYGTADGSYRWSHVLSGDDYDEATAVVVDEASNVYVGGRTGGGTSIGGRALGEGNAFVASFDLAGNPRWSRALPGRVLDLATGRGELLVGGADVQADTSLDPASLAVYDTEGEPLWAIADPLSVSGVAMASDGSIYATGDCSALAIGGRLRCLTGGSFVVRYRR